MDQEKVKTFLLVQVDDHELLSLVSIHWYIWNVQEFEGKVV